MTVTKRMDVGVLFNEQCLIRCISHIQNVRSADVHEMAGVHLRVGTAQRIVFIRQKCGVGI